MIGSAGCADRSRVGHGSAGPPFGKFGCGCSRGLIADLAAKGLLTPLGESTRKWLVDNYAAGGSWATLGTYRGKDGQAALYAFPYKVDLQSLVWYSSENFADAGLKCPRRLKS